MPADTQNRDLTLPPDTYLYLQNEGKGGLLSVHRGPTVVNQTGQDQPVRYEAQNRRFVPCSLEQAVQQFPRAGEGDYVIIENPTDGTGRFPTETSQNAVELQKGRRINIPGPWSEALYPGQIASVIEGHRLRSNQYCIAIIYNSEEAEKNWETGTVVEAQTEPTEGEVKGDAKPITKAEVKKGGLPKPESFAVGTRIRITGTDVSFYIPCTGVEVLRDEDTGEYVREAVTLEQMEYCCKVSESGKKTYPIGPAVVFPEPTEIFEKDGRGRRKFRPIELNSINGIHLKVTADFKGEDLEKAVDGDGKRPERQYREGEELFVTGKTLAIYYPREELAIIEYGQGNKKHFSTAVPKGEGRYVIDRETGDIELVRGPKMLLPDPRTQILVRRRLDLNECRLMYPGEEGEDGNPEVIAYNMQLAEVMAAAPSGRSGVVSEGDYRKSQAKAARRTRGAAAHGTEALYMASDMSESSLEAFGGPADFEQESVSDEDAGKSVRRGTKYTEPRQLDLNTKYQGAVKVEVWPGYAILIVGSEGSRRVEEGPKTLLLEYDEKLGHMKLSTGKPKSTDRLLPTAYLCVQNNQVGDIVSFESSDHVKGTIKISLRVNFEGETQEDKLKWFSVDNYIKYLCDHVRSIIAGMGKRHTIAEIKANYIDLTRDALLGTKGGPSTTLESESPVSVGLKTSGRPGLGDFTNGMRVFEVEVLGLTIDDPSIAQMLDQAQLQVVRTNIEIEQAQKDLDATRTKLRIAQDKAKAENETERMRLQLQKDIIEDQLTVTLARIESSLKTIEEQKKERAEQEALTDISNNAQLARDKSQADQEHTIATETQKLELESLDAATKAAVERFNAAKDGLYEVMISLGRDDLAAKLAQGCTIERYLSGDDIGSSIANLLSFAPMLKQFFEKAEAVQTGNGNGNRLTQRETSPTG
jgi:major vault protein